MVQGLQLLGAIVRDKSTSGLKMIKPECLIGEEMPLYKFIINHAREYGKIPSKKTCLENGFAVELPPEPIDYYYDLLQKRTIYNIVRANYQKLKESMSHHDPSAAIDIMRKTLGQARVVADVDSLIDLCDIDEKSEFKKSYYANLAHSGLKGIPTGWPVLDEATSGMQKGDLLVLCGRPNVGKSYLLQQIAMFAWECGFNVLFISMEMSKEQVKIRIYSYRSKINTKYVRDAILTTDQKVRLFEVLEEDETLHSSFYVMAGDLEKTIADIELAIQEVKPDAVYIDAGYLVKDENSNPRANKYEKIADSMNAMKKLAIRRDVPIATSIQLGRGAEPTDQERKKQKFRDPTLANIGFTDEIGQLCSIAIGVIEYSEGIRKLVVMKNRDGIKPSFFTWFNFRLMDFSQLSANLFDTSTGRLMDDSALEDFS